MHVCWLKSPSLIGGFLVPMGIMLLVNCTIFCILLKKVVFRHQKVSKLIIKTFFAILKKVDRLGCIISKKMLPIKKFEISIKLATLIR